VLDEVAGYSPRFFFFFLPIIIPCPPVFIHEACDTADQSSVFKLETDHALGWLQSKGVFLSIIAC
jgi:hypothetical protein